MSEAVVDVLGFSERTTVVHGTPPSDDHVVNFFARAACQLLVRISDKSRTLWSIDQALLEGRNAFQHLDGIERHSSEWKC